MYGGLHLKNKNEKISLSELVLCSLNDIFAVLSPQLTERRESSQLVEEQDYFVLEWRLVRPPNFLIIVAMWNFIKRCSNNIKVENLTCNDISECWPMTACFLWYWNFWVLFFQFSNTNFHQNYYLWPVKHQSNMLFLQHPTNPLFECFLCEETISISAQENWS